MARMSAQERRESRLKRMRQSSTSRQGGSSISEVIDLSRLPMKPKFYEMKKRDNKIDILAFIVSNPEYAKIRDMKPYNIGPEIGIKPGEDDYKLQYAFHPSLGAEKKDYLCLRHMFGKACPVCEELDPIWSKKKEERTKEEQEKGKKLGHKWRVMYNIYDYADPDGGIKLLDYSYHLFEKFLQDKIEGDDGGILDFIDLEDGRTVIFDCREKSIPGSTNVFLEVEGIRFLEREPYEDDIYDTVFPLDTLLVIPTYEDVARALCHLDEEEDAPEAGDHSSRGSSSGRGFSRGASKSEEDDRPTGRGVSRREESKEEEKPSGRRGLGTRREEEPKEEKPAGRGRRGQTDDEKEDIPCWVEGKCPEGLEFGTDCNTDGIIRGKNNGSPSIVECRFLETVDDIDRGGGIRIIQGHLAHISDDSLSDSLRLFGLLNGGNDGFDFTPRLPLQKGIGKIPLQFLRTLEILGGFLHGFNFKVDYLIQKNQSLPGTSIRCLCNPGNHLLVDIRPLLITDIKNKVLNVRGGQFLHGKGRTSIPNGLKKFFRFRRAEHKVDVRRGVFQSFEHGVLRILGHGMAFVHKEDPASSFRRHIPHRFHDLPDGFNPPVITGVDLRKVAAIDGASELLGNDPCQGRLPTSGGAFKKPAVGVILFSGQDALDAGNNPLVSLYLG